MMHIVFLLKRQKTSRFATLWALFLILFKNFIVFFTQTKFKNCLYGHNRASHSLLIKQGMISICT